MALANELRTLMLALGNCRTTDDDLLRLGMRCGGVISHKAIIDATTGMCKGLSNDTAYMQAQVLVFKCFVFAALFC